jgi:hypothetical protein
MHAPVQDATAARELREGIAAMELRRLVTGLAPWRRTAAVQDIVEAIAAV